MADVHELVAEARRLLGGSAAEEAPPTLDECFASIRRLADALENMEALLREARDSGYLKQKVTSNETGLDERVDTALDAARKEG